VLVPAAMYMAAPVRIAYAVLTHTAEIYRCRSVGTHGTHCMVVLLGAGVHCVGSARHALLVSLDRALWW
jgi:hypothetical protein